VQRRHQPRFLLGQLEAEELPEEVMVSVPLPVVVEGDQEQVGLLQLGQQLAGVLGLQHGVAQRRRQALQDRGPDHEGAQRLGLAGQHLAAEVVDDVAVAGPEGGDERLQVRAAPQRQAGQDQPGRPALGPLPQPLHRLWREVQSHGVPEQAGGLGVGEPQVELLIRW
jgi:hypothetical protein